MINLLSMINYRGWPWEKSNISSLRLFPSSLHASLAPSDFGQSVWKRHAQVSCPICGPEALVPFLFHSLSFYCNPHLHQSITQEMVLGSHFEKYATDHSFRNPDAHPAALPTQTDFSKCRFPDLALASESSKPGRMVPENFSNTS